MGKNDTTVLYHPGGTRIELDEDHKVRVDMLKARGYTTSPPVKPTPQPPAQK